MKMETKTRCIRLGSWRSFFIFLVVLLLAANPACARRSRSKGARTGDQGGLNSTEAEDDTGQVDKRRGKFLNLFGIVRFPNSACGASNGRNGTCYTLAECASRGGANGGACARGFGVCCLFSLGCGGTSRENCTYFSSSDGGGPQPGGGGCTAKVCPCGANVCQLRLDFDTFAVAGPSTASASVAKALFGVVVFTASLGVSVSQSSQCLTDTFSVSSPGNNAPPQICGANTGQHMYVDASQQCNDLTFQLGSQGVGTALPTRAWNIKVTQYTCDYPNLAPDGCTQYYFGASTDQVQTYNYDGGQHLASQDQNICVRRERGNCRICWTTSNPSDFQVSGSTSLGPLTTGSACCSYGRSGSNVFGFDCLTIPGARKTASFSVPAASRICGRSNGIVTALLNNPMTICSVRTPFSVRFLSDQYEFTGFAGSEGMLPNAGFRLTYTQDSVNC